MERPEETPVDAPKPGLVARLRAWSTANPSRNFAVAMVLVATAVATVASWLTVAEIAAQPEAATLERALAALDAGDEELARAIVDEMRRQEDLSGEEYGGVFFVMGALKSSEAQRQWSPERARTDYFVAARYLSESRGLGFPEGREREGLFRLGQALIASRQLEKGIDTLREALDAGVGAAAEVHLLLAEAYFNAPSPDYARAIEETEAGLRDPDIPRDRRSAAELMRAEALAALGRGEEAATALAGIGPEADPAQRALVEGKAAIARLEAAGPGQAAASLAEEAAAALARARRLDKLSTSVTRQSDYLSARIAELIGDTKGALEAYSELRRTQGGAPAGVAGAFAEAALRQEAGDNDEAVESYRRALDAIDDVSGYQNPLLPLDEARRRIQAAHQRFVDDEAFQAALQLSDRVGRLIGRGEQLEMRARTLEEWGDSEVAAAARRAGSRGRRMLRDGRRRLREAGVAYEQRAETRYADRAYTDDLWAAAEAFHRGQAYAEAARVLKRYLREEPVQRNALALVRLGEAYLARGSGGHAIEAFEECLEFHDTDASSYRARLACAKAYRERDRFDRAEELLRHNLTRTALSPASPEWRDSKFLLGEILAEQGRHDEAIGELEEAVARYPNADQSRTARYLIAESHRHAAAEPLARLKEANTVSERERARGDAETHLEQALRMYRQVEQEITLADSTDELDRATLRNCLFLAGQSLFELGRYEEAIQSFSSVSTLYQNEPFMLEALVHIYYCWRRLHDRPKALGVIQQARNLLDRLPPEADFATSTNLSRGEWDRLLTLLAPARAPF